MNLLLVSIDSLRFDFVSRTNPAIHTPRFDALSRSFSFSDQCFSVSSATRPVHTTLFTGLYPSEHGVLGQRSPRMRPGLPHLFPLLAGAGYQVAGFSQAPTIFAGLDYEPWIAPLEERALAKALGGAGRRGVFLHYWDTHAPYGAADRKAMGSTAALLRQGRRSEVIAAYQRAVATTFEQHLAPLLAGLDLDRWMVLICGDHGQSWTTAEPYHGQSLDNSVLRVPLFLHLPRTGNPPLPALLSLVNVFPTVAGVLGLDLEYRGWGRDLRHPDRSGLYLAELDPGGAQGLEPGLLGAAPEGRQWALFDRRRKFTCWAEAGSYRLEETFSGAELPLTSGEIAAYTDRYREMMGKADMPVPAADPAVDQRLRDLGYL